MYMDDIKLFGKKERELVTQIQSTRIHSQELGIKFVVEKCAQPFLKSRKKLNSGKKITAKSKRKIVFEEKEKIQVFGNIRIG